MLKLIGFLWPLYVFLFSAFNFIAVIFHVSREENHYLYLNLLALLLCMVFIAILVLAVNGYSRETKRPREVISSLMIEYYKTRQPKSPFSVYILKR